MMSPRSPSFRIGLVTAPAVALALLLGACGSDNQVGTPTPAQTPGSSMAASSTMSTGPADESSMESSTQESNTQESSTEESSTAESSAEKPTDKSSSAPVTAEGPTKPGTTLRIGEPAIIEYQTGKKGEKYFQHGTMSTTVTKIVKADPKVFDTLDNKADFKDLVPYYVFSEAKILSYDGEKDGNPPTQAVLYGLLPDGTEAGKAFSFSTSIAGCEDTYFDGPKVGATATKCSVTLGKKGGKPVVGAAYEGDTDLYADSTDNPYTKSPVVWGP